MNEYFLKGGHIDFETMPKIYIVRPGGHSNHKIECRKGAWILFKGDLVEETMVKDT